MCVTVVELNDPVRLAQKETQSSLHRGLGDEILCVPWAGMEREHRS